MCTLVNTAHIFNRKPFSLIEARDVFGVARLHVVLESLDLLGAGSPKDGEVTKIESVNLLWLVGVPSVHPSIF